MKAVRGVASAAAFYVECPRCHDLVTDPCTGSQMVGRDTIDALRGDLPVETIRRSGVVATCHGCLSRVQIPASVVRALVAA